MDFIINFKTSVTKQNKYSLDYKYLSKINNLRTTFELES